MVLEGYSLQPFSPNKLPNKTSLNSMIFLVSGGRARPVPDSFFFVSSIKKAFYVQSLLLKESMLMSIVVVALSGQVERTFVTYGMYE